MKRLLLTFAACLTAGMLLAQPADSVRLRALGDKLEEYFTALAGADAALQGSECDFLISSCQDSLLRQWVALKIYDHYLNSRIMGDDAVAVHVAREWFLSGKVPMMTEMDLLNAKVFVEFNRQSLIGLKAPVLMMQDASFKSVPVPGEGEYAVLYFYDTSCSTCRIETARLTEFLSQTEYPVHLYAVYSGSDKASWEQYRSRFPSERVTHVWDPEMTTDFIRTWGVLQTPKMFLIDPSGVIVGRGLDTGALSLLLERAFGKEGYTYGSEAQMAVYDQLFAPYGDRLKASDVVDVADYVAARTLGEGDMDAFKHWEGDLLYYLSSRRGEAWHEGAAAFIGKYIDAPDVWTTPEDSLKVLSLAGMMKDLLARTPAGSVVPDLSVEGVLRQRPCLFRKGSVPGRYNLRSLRGNPSYVVFYSQGCGECQRMLEAVERLVTANRKAKVLLVDMDSLFADNPAGAQLLLDTFDLSALPFGLELDKSGKILHKYIVIE